MTGDQVGESVGRADGSVREQESRAASVHPGQLRPGRHRLRGDVQAQAARDHQLQLRRARRRGSQGLDHQEGDLVEPEHRAVDDRRRHRDSVAQQGPKKLKHEFLADAREFGWNFLAAYTGRGIRDRFGGSVVGKVKRTARVGPRAGLLPSAERGRRVHAGGAGQDDQLLEDAAVGALCVHVLGVPTRGLREEREGLREVGRRLLQAAQVPLQHAARVVLHPQGSELAALVHLGRRHHLARSDSRARASNEPDAWPTFLKAFNEWAHQRGGIPLQFDFRTSKRAASIR